MSGKKKEKLGIVDVKKKDGHGSPLAARPWTLLPCILFKASLLTLRVGRV
jgi:hypothetical protein